MRNFRNAVLGVPSARSSGRVAIGGAAVFALLGCGPIAVMSEDDEGTGSATVLDATDVGTTTSRMTSTAPNEDTSDESSEGPAVTSAAFIEDPDGGGTAFECDMFEQDCRPGFKCMIWANDGSSTWNATRCFPVAEDPAGPGEPCTAEVSGVSGIDDCELASMCWNVDPKTLEGYCIAWCGGEASDPTCDDPQTQCTIGTGPLALCMPLCDPIEQDCPEGQACYPINSDWTCSVDASGEMGAYGDPCEYINACDPGLICIGATVFAECDGGNGCCTEVCDITSDIGDAQCTGAAQGQTCQRWYEEGAAPPGYEDVGACALPA